MSRPLKSTINTDILMRWAKRKLGPSKCKKIVIVDRKIENHGWYDWQGTIYINLRYLGSTTSVYRTLAHEWTHAQQKYQQYLKHDISLGYRRNPCEIAARRREHTCFKEMFVTL